MLLKALKKIGESNESRNSNTIIGNADRNTIPVAVFLWLYLESKDKNKTILEISKNIDDPSKLEDLVALLDERKNSRSTIEEVVLLHYLSELVFSFLVCSLVTS